MECVHLKFLSARNQSGQLTVEDLLPVMVKLKDLGKILTEVEIRAILGESYSNMNDELDFESFLRVSLQRMEVSWIFLSFHSLDFENFIYFLFSGSIGAFKEVDVETEKKTN